jgi:hypothetical protein
VLIRFVGAGIFTAVSLIEKADRTFSLLPPYRRARGVVLDTVLGPAEKFEYASKTTPTGQPPAIS